MPDDGADNAEPSGAIEFDPPLGKMPPWSFRHPVLDGASERWRKGGGGERLLQILKHGENASTFSTFIVFSAAMFLVPAAVMLLAHTLVLDMFFTFGSSGDKMMYSGIAGICSVQLVVICFLVFAFNEKVEPEEGAAADAKKKS